MDKALIVLIHELLNGNSDAIAQLNDIFEENGLERKEVKRNIVYHEDDFYEVISVIEPIEENARKIGLDELLRIYNCTIEDEDDVASLLRIDSWDDNNSSLEDWLQKAERWYEICRTLGFKIERISDPRDWNFQREDMEIPGFVEFFEKICRRVKENWFK